MNRFVRTGAVALLLLAFAMVQLPRTVAAEELRADPPSGPAGTTFTFHISGFDHGERVGYWLNAPNGTVLVIDDRRLNASDGDFTYSWTSVPGIPVGYWLFVAEGISSGDQFSVPFEVTAPAEGTANASNVEPKSGEGGTTYAFFANGFSGGERVGYWLNTPDGSIFKIDDQKHYATSDGRFDIHWKSPTDAAPGTWQMVFQGAKSGILHTISFEIRPH